MYSARREPRGRTINFKKKTEQSLRLVVVVAPTPRRANLLLEILQFACFKIDKA